MDKPVDLLPLCDECRSLVRHLVGSTPLDVRVECNDIPPVYGSSFHLQQVLLNLMTV
jgi:signal transduction histidine kinase